MHDAPRLGIERVPPVQYGEIVPYQEIADLPFMAHGEARLGGMRPERVEQRLALGDFQAQHISVRPAAEEQCLAPRPGFGADQRMMRAHHLPDVGDLFVALAEYAGA